MFGALSTLAYFAFLYEPPMTTVSVVGALGSALSSVGNSLVLAVAVSYERLWWTLGATLLGFLQPAAIIYKLEEVFRERGDPSSTMYEQVWLSALVPAFAMTIVVRLAMARLTLRVAYGTYGKGMKEDPYARDISVPRELKVHLASSPPHRGRAGDHERPDATAEKRAVERAPAEAAAAPPPAAVRGRGWGRGRAAANGASSN